ncbi:hypothetical protein CDD83_3312 [Cordyceps sp. RAO-2017]|nr:hypothetical protein CDD83_3312 [Cordyceps sp. RAO-2017]
MAPKEPFAVHSLSKHIADTKKGLSAEAQYNRRPANRATFGIKKEAEAADKAIFGSDDDSTGEDASSDSDSDSAGGSDYLKKLTGRASQPKSTPVPSSRRPKDDEIADSDVERKTSASKAASTKSIKAEADDTSSGAESDSATSQESANGVQEQESSSNSSDSGSESSSENESDSDDEAVDKAVKKSESTSESETSDSESDSESEDDKAQAKPATNGQTTSSTSDSQSSDSEESEAEKGKRAEATMKARHALARGDKDSSHEAADESIHMDDRQIEGQVAPNFIAPDFVLRKSADDAQGQDVARICNQANLDGKQFWYFTVPSNVPISVVQNLEIPMDQAQRGEKVFSHAGQDYGISFDSITPKSSIQILIPSADGSQYQAAPRRPDQVMQVRRITQLDIDGSTCAPSDTRAPRAQPEGLKARFKPIGVNDSIGNTGMDGSTVGEDHEMTDAPALPAPAEREAEKSTPKSSKKKKHKASAGNDGKDTASSRKGKRKHTTSEDDAVAADEQLVTESQTAGSQAKKPKMERGSPDLGSEPPSSTAPKKQTPVLPPFVPSPSYPMSSLGLAPAAASTPKESKSRKTKKAKDKTPVPSSSLPLPAKRDTPVPLPRQTAVPLPPIPSSGQQPKVTAVQPPMTPAAASMAKDAKKARKSKGSEGKATLAASSQPTSPPPSAQGSKKSKKSRATESKATA